LKIALFANTEWYLFNFRLPLAKALAKAGHEVVLISPPGPYGEKLVAAGFRWIAFPLNRAGTNPLGELRTLIRLVKLYRRERFDLVHHFTIKCVIYGGIAARLCGAGSVAAITGLGHVFTTYSLKNRFLRYALRPLYWSALGQAQVIFQNPDDMSAFLALGLVAERQCHLIRGSGVHTSRFAPNEHGAEATQRVRVLMVGRLLQEKGVAEYVDAAALVKQQFPTADFALAGEPDPGNPSSISNVTLDQWRKKGDVTLLGQRDDMPALLAETDICVLPSYREGTPRSLLEAAACGLPLVATDVPGCREICRAGENGLLVPVRDAAALAAAIQRLIESPPLRAAMGKRSREIAVGEFSEASVIAETLKVYQIATCSRKADKHG